MESKSFNTLLVNFTSLTSDEADQLQVLVNEFPYSQVIHNLAARSAQDNNLSAKEKLLHQSAIYSTDRAALKSMITSSRRARVEYRPVVIEEVVTPSVAVETSNEPIYERLMIDLASMQESKRHFEEVAESIENGKVEPLAPKEKPKVKTEPVTPVLKEGESLIEEIKSTKKKIKPEGSRQIEQIEIIDQFIKAQPAIPRPKATPAVAHDNDLSEPSAQFGENIVSETLVEILLKQGKKEKAIEALKKLIWKFPQKKAYFAAQIEDLRK